MRCYNIVSGILILSIIDFALTAPVFVPEKRQPGVDVVHIPKDVIPVLGKRGEEDLAKLAEEFSKTWGRPIDSSDAHALSSSAPPGPDVASSSSAPPEPDHVSPSSTPTWSQESDDGSIASGPLFTPESSLQSSPEHPLAGVHAQLPNSYMPSQNADPNFDWAGWMKKVNSPEPGPWTEGIDLGPEYQVGHVEPNLGSPTGSDDYFDWKGWLKKVNSPEPGPWTEGIGMGPEYQAGHAQPNLGSPTGADDGSNWDHWTERINSPELRPWTEGTSPGPEYQDNSLTSSPISLTESNSDRNLMAAHQLPPYPPSPTEFDMALHSTLPPIKTDRDPYANPPSSPTDLYTYSYPGTVAHTLPSGTDLPAVPDHEVVPPTPSTNPELYLDPPSSSTADLPAADLPATDSQLEDDQARRYALKGKAKVLDFRRVSGTTREIRNGAQKELQSAERSLDAGQ